MFSNIDVETTDEKVQALLDYLNEENDVKLTADDIEVEEQRDFYEYFTDIESESDSCFENRLQRELAEVDGFFEDDMQRYLDLEEQKEDLRVELDDIKYDIKKLEEKISKEEDNPYKEKLEDDLSDLTREKDRISERLEDVWVEFDYDEFTKWIEPYEDDKDNLIDKAVHVKMADWDNSLDWYLDEFGKETMGYLLNNGLAEVNMDELVDYIIDTDGRGSNLAGWDGVEIEQDDFYIYKQDDFIYECDKSDKEEECEMAD